MSWYCKLCWAVFLLCLSVEGAQSDDDGIAGQDEAASLLSGHIANSEALSNFDVLIETSQQWVGENGAVEDEFATERLIIDIDSGTCCSVRKLKRTRYLAGKNGAKEETSDALRVAVCDGNEAWCRSFPNKAYQIKDVGIEQVLGENRSTIVHAVALVPYPYDYDKIDRYRSIVDSFRFGKGTINLDLMTALDGNPAVKISRNYSDEHWQELTIEFAEDTLVPVRLSKLFSYHGKRTIYTRERFEFVEKDGIFLPKTITGERREHRMVDEVRVPGVGSYDVTFHWQAINELPKPSPITLDLVRDANAAVKLTSLGDDKK